MLDPPFSGLSVGRRSLRDWRPAVRTVMKWQRVRDERCSASVALPMALYKYVYVYVMI